MMEEELDPSVLGSYDFWDSVYCEEKSNFDEYGDVGEIWFGKKTAEKIVNWICENSTIQKNSPILDFGCGNGMLLINLYEKGFSNLHGVDYSKNAIDLAKSISKTRKTNINFFVGNALDEMPPSSYNLALDKGTYDAISLDPEDSKSKREGYIKNIYRVLKENGLFVIASCNWTSAELIHHLSDFDCIESLPAPTFQFGGKLGKTVTILVFKKR